MSPRPMPSIVTPFDFRPQAYMSPHGGLDTGAVIAALAGVAISAAFVLGVVQGSQGRR